MKKIPMRSCVVTHEKLEKRELLRIVRDKFGVVSIDKTGKAPGRGAYIKKDINVVEKAKKSKILDKVLEVNIEDSFYEEIKNNID